jgi:filamentous hemagglutinin
METTIVDSHKRPVRDTHPLWARCLAGLLIVALQLAPLKATFDQVAGLRLTLAAAHAAPIADPFAPIQFRPTLNQSSAGVPVVNITAPNAAGMSRNQFERFDVGAVGLILNNSLAGGGTLLGGQVGANPNFSGRAASLVLNEVTSTGSAFASHLAGPIELFGFPAALVIANPNGITCTGCGFINTPQATLTTGVPQFLNAPGGALSSFESATALGFDVQQERIAIEDAGLDATGSRVDLFAESIVVNAPIRANLAHGTLNLIAGRNHVVGAADGALELSANRAIQAASAGYAIDGTAFGAMSAGSIKIVATPEGLGVKTDGALAAASGSLTISANGELRVANAYARSDVDLSARGDANASGTLASNGDLRIEAMGDLSASELSAGDAELSAAGALRVNKMTVRGALAAQAGGDLELTGEASIARNATLNAGGTLSNVGIVATSGVLDLRAARLVNRGTLYGESAALAAAELDNAGGRLLAETDLRLTAGAMTNTAGLVAARADVRLSVSGAFDNAAGSLLAQRDLALSVPNAVLDSATGTLAAGNLLAIEALSLASSGAWTPHARHLTLNLQSDFAHSGTLELAGDLSVSTAGSVANSGRLSAGGTVELAGASVTNSGSLAANEDLELRGALTNRGTMAALRDVRIMGASFDNTSASVQADRNLSIDLAGTLENTGGSLTALGNTEIRASAVLNDRTAPGAQITVTRGHNPALLDTLVLIPEATSYDPGCHFKRPEPRLREPHGERQWRHPRAPAHGRDRVQSKSRHAGADSRRGQSEGRGRVGDFQPRRGDLLGRRFEPVCCKPRPRRLRRAHRE